MKNLVYPVILAGGSGTRLWPRSREKHPKQFMELVDGKSLFQITCLRFSDPLLFSKLTIVTHEDHKFLVRRQLEDIGIHDAIIIAEPCAKNTTAACLTASLFLYRTIGDVPIIFTPADHVIQDKKNLFTAIQSALPFITQGSVCVFGITPTTPHTGYGYIIKGNKLKKDIFTSESFKEKPDKETAIKYLELGALWNSGIYFCTSKTLLNEAKILTPKLLNTLESINFLYDKKFKEMVVVNKTIYETLESSSIDKAITERTSKLIVAPLSLVWSDLGSWNSIYDYLTKNSDGNVIKGDIFTINTKNSYIESDKRLVTAVGLDNIGIIETPDAVLVFSLQESEYIKTIVQELNKQKRNETVTHTTVHRPWGKYTILGDEEHFKSKKITVHPGAELSLQRHKHRAEHWIVVTGTATITRDGEVFELQANESTFLPMGSVHRLQNKHQELLTIIEIQTGTYFGEDDIERFEDTYGRV